MAQPEERLLKDMAIWVGTKNLFWCSGYNALTLQKRFLSCRERDSIQTLYPIWSTVRLSIL